VGVKIGYPISSTDSSSLSPPLSEEEREDEDHTPRQRQSEPAWGRTFQGRFGHASCQQISGKIAWKHLEKLDLM